MFIAFLVIVLAIALIVVLVRWLLIQSQLAIGPNQVGIILFMGDPEPEIHGPGRLFVPWTPKWWSGHRLWELRRIPTDMFLLYYKEEGEDALLTKDRMPATVEVTFCMGLPYNEEDSVGNLLVNNVPLSAEELKPWAKKILIPALYDAIREREHTTLISNGNLSQLTDEVNGILHADGSILRRCGVMGRDWTDTKPGTGSAYVKIESIRFPKEVEEAMQAKAKARYMADAATATADMKSEEIGGQTLGTVAKQHAMTREQLEADLRAHPKKRGKPVKDGGYAETFEWAQAQTMRDRAGNVDIEKSDATIDINSAGKSLEGADMKAVGMLVGGIVAAVAQVKGSGRPRKGGKGNRGGEKGSGGGKPPEEMDGEELDDWAEKFKKNKGKED